MSRRAILFMLALGVIVGCSVKQDSSASQAGGSPVFFVIKAIHDKHQWSPGGSYESNEIEVTVVVGSRSKHGLRFDQIQSVFYAGGMPWSGVTHILTYDDSIRAYYSIDGKKGAPDFPPEKVFELNYGEGTTVVIDSANSDYGLVAPGTERKVVVVLRLQGKTVYGPFDIGLPWPTK